MTLCSLCPLPSLKTSVDLLRTVWPVDEPSIVPSRTMVSVTELHGLTCSYKHTHPFTPPSPDPLHDVVSYICCFFVLRFFLQSQTVPAKEKVFLQLDRDIGHFLWDRQLVINGYCSVLTVNNFYI
ncbi:hypothetical protein GOODEAATRI_033770 [Goodea atripinnis]|uniref:Uncharacterized protein n=1 Tax=Goodea atripinnis TaxID=208336 RepID=A0ABV0MMW4_9TELE